MLLLMGNLPASSQRSKKTFCAEMSTKPQLATPPGAAWQDSKILITAGCFGSEEPVNAKIVASRLPTGRGHGLDIAWSVPSSPSPLMPEKPTSSLSKGKECRHIIELSYDFRSNVPKANHSSIDWPKKGRSCRQQEGGTCKGTGNLFPY